MPVSDHINTDWRPVVQSHQAFASWGRLAVAVGVLTMLFATAPDSDLANILRLERLAHNIEDATELSLQARESIGRQVRQQKEIVGLSLTYEPRRKAAIERVATALKAKEDATSVHRRVTSNFRNTGN